MLLMFMMKMVVLLFIDIFIDSNSSIIISININRWLHASKPCLQTSGLRHVQ